NDFAVDQQRAVRTRTALQLAILLMHFADLFEQLFVAFGPRRWATFAPGVKTTARDLEHAADYAHRPTLAVRLDEGKLHGCSFAKHAAAFFKISRSMSS